MVTFPCHTLGPLIPLFNNFWFSGGIEIIMIRTDKRVIIVFMFNFMIHLSIKKGDGAMKKSENVEKKCRREKNDTPGKGIEKRRRSSQEVCAEKRIRSDHQPDQICLKKKRQDGPSGSSRFSDIIFKSDIESRKKSGSQEF